MNHRHSIRRAGLRFAIFSATALFAVLPGIVAATLAHKYSFTVGNIQSGFFQSYQDGSGGYALVGFWDGTLPSEGLVRYDNNLAEIGNVHAQFPATSEVHLLFGAPDSTTQFLAASTDSGGFVDFGRFNLSNLSAVFAKRLTTTASAEKTQVLILPNNRIGVLQDLGTSIKITLFDSVTGNLVFEQTYTSATFVASGASTGQTAEVIALPDGSGYALIVASYTSSIGGSGLSYDTNIVIAYLTNTGAVGTTARLQWTAGGAVAPAAIFLPDNSILLHALEQSFDLGSGSITAQNHLFNIRANGTLNWAKVVAGGNLTLAAGDIDQANSSFYMAGHRFVTQGQDPTSDAVLARFSLTNGSLLNQAGFNLADTEIPAIIGRSASAVFVHEYMRTGTGAMSKIALLKLPLDLSSVSAAVEYTRDVTVGAAVRVAATSELLFSSFENSQDITAITLTENLTASTSCSLFSPLTVTLANPGLTVTNSSVTPTAVTVNAASSTPVTSTASFTLSHSGATSTNVCGSSGGSAPVITSALTASGTVGTAFSYTISASNSPTSYNATGLPAGLAINTSSGAITGTPTTAATTNVTISATNASGTGQATLQITISSSASAPVINTQPANASAVVGTSAQFTIAASGTGLTYQWQRQAAGTSTWSNLSNGGAFSGVTTATLTVSSAADMNGDQFRVVVSNGTGADATSNAATLTVASSFSSRLLNLSTRGLVQTGDNVLIPGFVISGTANKKLLIRAVGPTLGKHPFNLAGVLANPRMTLKKLNTTVTPNRYDDIANNDDWATNSNAAAITQTASDLSAFAFNDDREAALLMDLAPGQYTVVADGVSAATGIAIVELYDGDAASVDSRLINISNRGFCGIGDQVMIPGFVVSSESSRTVLIRVVGPTLGAAPFNVAGTMADPKLELYRRETGGTETLVATQDNWGEATNATQTAQIAAQVSAFALTTGSKDAAFVVTLEPGSYTVVGSSAVANGTGVVLVEVYVVP